MAIYMKFGDIKGDATTEGLKDWIQISSFQFGVGRGISSPSGSDKSRESSEPSLSEVTVTKNMDSASPKLLGDAWGGELGSKVDIKFTTTTKNTVVDFLTYSLENCGISGYSVSSGGDLPQESLSLNYTKISVTFKPMDPTNKSQPATVFYDLTQMKAG
jgi:type VI secretion system secreted protein Hcp